MLKILLKTGVKPKNLLHTAANLEIAKLLIVAGDKPTSFYDNKRFISKQVKNFIYPPSPKKKTPKKSPIASKPKPKFDYDAFRKRQKEKRKKGRQTLKEKIFGKKKQQKYQGVFSDI